MKTDVLIVGAGPVGLTLGTQLSRLGLSYRIVDQSAGPVSTSNALAIHARTLELLESSGLLTPFVERGTWVDCMELHGSGRMLAHLDFHSLKSRFRGILVLPQSQTERLLARDLAGHGINVERSVKLVAFDQDGSGVAAVLEHADGSQEQIHCDWLVGCDGAHSFVRHQLGVPFEGVTHEEQFAITDAQLQWSIRPNQVSMFFHREGPVLTIPLPESRWRIVVDITSSPDTPRPEPPTFDEMRLIFSRRVPIAAVLTDPTWVSSFTVNRRRVSRLRSERVFLAGDAAHVHSPAGGQGMNTGMQDAFNLGWKLSLVQRGRAKTSLLDTYHVERMPVIRGVLALTDTALKLGTQKGVIADHLRSIAVPLLSGWEFVQRNVVSELSEIGIDYRRSPIVDSDGSFAADVPHAGDRAPLPPSGSDELVLSTNTHHLLLFAGDNTSEENWSMLQSLRRDFESAYPGLVHAHVIPSSSELRGKYSVVETALFLIRPDGYIAYRSSRADSVALHRFLEESYGWKAAHEEASERV